MDDTSSRRRKAPPTILAHKTGFLNAQTLHLSQSLAPSASWLAANERAANNNNNENENSNAVITQRQLDDAMYRLNQTLAQHARRVYAPQASRHVAEQIESLILAAADRYRDAVAAEEEEEEERLLREGGGGNGADGTGEVGRRPRLGADFANESTISALAPDWSHYSPAQTEAAPDEARRYAEFVESLASLSARRTAALERVERLRRMKEVLEPFAGRAEGEGKEAGAGGRGIDRIQPNLVTRGGEMEKELERMRFLLVRVAGRVGQLPDPPPLRRDGDDGDGDVRMADGGDDVLIEDMDVVARGKVDRLLDGF